MRQIADRISLTIVHNGRDGTRNVRPAVSGPVTANGALLYSNGISLDPLFRFRFRP